MTSRIRIYCIFAIICMAASCSRVPKNIISERKMRVVLYDMLIAEAMVETMPASYPSNDDRELIYEAVFRKHKITQADYDSSLVWYGKHMDLYMAIYKLVLKDVNANLHTLGEIKPSPLSGDVSAQDSVDIWVYPRSSIIHPERVFNTLTFDINPETPYSSGSSYVFGVSVWGMSPDLKHKPVIHLSAVHADTIISVRKDITDDGYYEAIVRTIVSKQVRRIYGYIMMNDADASYHRIYLNDIRLMKYNYGSKALTAPQEIEDVP